MRKHTVRTITFAEDDVYPFVIGAPLREEDFTTRITDDTDVYLDNGKSKRLLLSFRKHMIPHHKRWFSMLDECVSTPILMTDRRLCATGAKTRRRAMVKSGVMGFYDGLTPQHKAMLGNLVHRRIHTAGRATAFTRHYPDRWERCVPFFQILSKIYKKVCPSMHNAQQAFVQTIEPDLRIPDTVFTTITVNQNWVTHTHTDKGDYADGMSCLAVMGHGFVGGYMGFPRRKILVEMKPGDVIFMDAHEPHGNTPLYLGTDDKRLSFVCYARTNLARFHTPVTTPRGKTFFLE